MTPDDPDGHRAILTIAPEAIRMGPSVLHDEGWTTQIPRVHFLAVLAGRPENDFPVRVSLHERPEWWFRVMRPYWHRAYFDDGQPVGVPRLHPAAALADMVWAGKGDGCWLDPDDIEDGMIEDDDYPGAEALIRDAAAALSAEAVVRAYMDDVWRYGGGRR